MDEAIWAAVGIISAILALGIVANLLLQNNDEMDMAQAEDAMAILEAECNQVCTLPVNTATSVSLQIPSGTILRVESERICIENVKNPDQITCKRCDCQHGADEIVLNLTDATPFFKSHTYKCRYTKLETINNIQRVKLECSG